MNRWDARQHSGNIKESLGVQALFDQEKRGEGDTLSIAGQRHGVCVLDHMMGKIELERLGSAGRDIILPWGAADIQQGAIPEQIDSHANPGH